MTDSMLKTYTTLVNFLGAALGPCYEVVLQDLSNDRSGIVAIANGNISGRSIGSPLTGNALKLLMSRRYEESDTVLNYKGMLDNGHITRSSTMFLYENGKPAGLLCINFDPTEFTNISHSIQELIHPDSFIKKYLETQIHEETAVVSRNTATEMAEYFSSDSNALMQELFTESVASLDAPSARLRQEEKLLLISKLYECGMFKLKGAVQYVADKLDCSPASVYRYLGTIKRRNGE